MIAKGVFFIGEMMRTLVTKRLILRDLKLSDLSAFYAYCKKPNIGPMAGWEPHQSLAESFKILKLMIKDQEIWAITPKEEDIIIGTIGLHVRNHVNQLENRREIGYVLDDTYWGQGLMTEAVLKVIKYSFETLGLDELVCAHMLDNMRSKRVIKKCGFTYIKNEYRESTDKQKTEVMLYKLTLSEYEEMKKNDKSINKI